MTATQLLYEAAGFDLRGTSQGSCYLCGGPVFDPIPAKLPPTFMDHDKARHPSSPYLCRACEFSMAEQSELLAGIVGKGWGDDVMAVEANPDRLAKWEKKHRSWPTPEEIGLVSHDGGWCIPQRMRNYSHFVVDGRWLPLSKADKRRMYELLLSSPQLAVIAVSGQKHIIFRAQPGLWQVEEQSIEPRPDALQALVHAVARLYETFNKSEIEHGDYMTYRVMKHGVERWQADEAILREWRGSPYLELAVFLVRPKEDYGQGGASQPSDTSGVVSVAGDGPGVQATVRQGDLGPVSGPAPGRGDGDQQPGDVSQLALF